MKYIFLLPLVLGALPQGGPGGISPAVALSPWGVATPLSGGMNAPGTQSAAENAEFDEITFVDDTDEFMKIENGEQKFVNLGNPDGDVVVLPPQQGEFTSGDVLGRVLSSTQGGKKTFTYRRKARLVDSNTTFVDRFRAWDTTDPSPLSGPMYKVFDDNVVNFAVFVVVTNVP